MLARAADRALALLALAVLPPLLRLVPLRRTLALCDAWPRLRGGRLAPAALAHRVDRWLPRGRGPWAFSCLSRSVVLYALLRQHGHRPRLHVGAAGSARSFEAHAWLTLGGVPALEPAPAALARYRELLAHPAHA